MATYRYLLDTNVLSEPARKNPSETLVSRLRAESARCVTASPVWHELIFGVHRLPEGNRRSYLSDYLSTVIRPAFPILSYEEEAAYWHGRERAHLEAAGRSPTQTDGQIAAIAVTRDLILVTRNVSDFEDFRDLHVENWFEA